jgi:hypothetical protein
VCWVVGWCSQLSLTTGEINTKLKKLFCCLKNKNQKKIQILKIKKI